MFTTYIISLKGDHQRYQSVFRELTDSHIPAHFIKWFEAWKGSEHRDDPRVVNMCKTMCSDFVIGCALSHIELATHFLTSSNDSYCLVLEDDVVIPNKETFIQDVQHLYLEHSSSDVIKLFCQGICNDAYPKRIGIPSFYLDGSTAAYILTREGARRLSKMNILTHIDIQFNKLNIINKQRVLTRDSEIYNSFYDRIPIFNQPVSFWAKQEPIGNINVIKLILIPIVYAYYIYKYNRSIIHINLLLFMLAFIQVFPFFVINYFQSYNCSDLFQTLGLLFPLCVILYLSVRRPSMKTISYELILHLLLLFSCHLVLMFYILHKFSKQ